MPRNRPTRGMRFPMMILTSMMTWANSSFQNKRFTKNTYPTNVRGLGLKRKHPKRRTHTQPVIRTKENSGDTNPTRMRHAATKAAHALKRMKGMSEEVA